jgi:hypothetical protein
MLQAALAHRPLSQAHVFAIEFDLCPASQLRHSLLRGWIVRGDFVRVPVSSPVVSLCIRKAIFAPRNQVNTIGKAVNDDLLAICIGYFFVRDIVQCKVIECHRSSVDTNILAVFFSSQ